MKSIYLEPLMSEEYDYKMILKAEREEGKLEGHKDIAKQMIINNIDIDTIVKCTGLTKEEIEKL